MINQSMVNDISRIMLLLLFTLNSHFLYADVAKKSIVIVTGQYPPLIDKNRLDKGYIARLVSDAFAQEGISTEFLFVPWGRALRMVDAGKEVAVMYYAKTKKRSESFIFSDPIFSDNWVFFYLKKTKVNWQELEDLAGYKIAATISYTYNKEFYRLANNNTLNVVWQPYDKNNWHLLMTGRVDIFANGHSAWNYVTENYPPEIVNQLAIHPKPLAHQFDYLLFSKAHPDAAYFQEKFNQGFTKLKRMKTLEHYLPHKVGMSWPEVAQPDGLTHQKSSR